MVRFIVETEKVGKVIVLAILHCNSAHKIIKINEVFSKYEEDLNMCDIYTVKLLTAAAIESILPFVAAVGIKHYREYPYLYEANQKEVFDYLAWLSKLPQTAVAVAYEDKTPIGFALGTALIDYAQEIYPQNFEQSIKQFRDQGKNPEQYYYIADNITLPEHENSSVTKLLFDCLEEYAHDKGFKGMSFAAESYEKHPLKPQSYQEPDDLWKVLGYAKTPLMVRFIWKTIKAYGPTKDEEHELYYWIKGI